LLVFPELAKLRDRIATLDCGRSRAVVASADLLLQQQDNHILVSSDGGLNVLHRRWNPRHAIRLLDQPFGVRSGQQRAVDYAAACGSGSAYAHSPVGSVSCIQTTSPAVCSSAVP
jgi:hypothetical protein